MDLLLKGGTVVDGTGTPGRRADVGVDGGRVAAVGDLASEPARRTVDVTGLVVCPGFVDVHTHYDCQVMWDPAMTPSSLHGVTTVAGGNCGFTMAPLSDGSDPGYLMEMMARVEGIPLEALRTALDWSWRSFGDWLDRLEGNVAINCAFCVGHSTVRRAVMGDQAGRPADAAEREALAGAVRASLEAGAIGLSSSWSTAHFDGNGDPVPSRASDVAELVALGAEVRRSHGTVLEFAFPPGPFSQASFEAMVAIATAADRPLNWNLLVVDESFGGYQEQLEASTRAAARGAQVLALTLPQVLRFRLSFLSGVVYDVLPGWAPVMHLPLEERCRALRERSVREQLRQGAAQAPGGMRTVADWAMTEVAEGFCPQTSAMVGRRIGDVARERDQDPFDLLLDAVLADQLRTALWAPGIGADEGSWARRADVWRDGRTVLGGSDAGAHLDMQQTAGYPTTFLRESVAERELISLEEAVRQLTDVPARLYGFRGRGRLQPGYQADLVAFDPSTVGCGPVHTREDLPGGSARLYAEAIGVERVLVNGTEVVAGNRLTGAVPGQVLRSGRGARPTG